jgi:hypothetical protein
MGNLKDNSRSDYKEAKKEMIKDYGRTVYRASKALTKAGETNGPKEARLEAKADRIIKRADTPLAPTPEPNYR